MDKVIIYGTGATAKFFVENLDDVWVCGVIDGDGTKEGSYFFGNTVLYTHNVDFSSLEVDKIIICSNSYLEILEDLKRYSISSDKIVVATIDNVYFKNAYDFFSSWLYQHLKETAKKIIADKIEEKHFNRLMEEVVDNFKQNSCTDDYPLSVYEDQFNHLDILGSECLWAMLRKPGMEISMENCFGYKNYIDKGFATRFMVKYNFPADCYPILCFLNKYVNKANVTFDVGANRGLVSVFFAKKYAYVHSFEPSHEVSQIAKKNIMLNGIKNIKWNELGVADTNNSLEYYDYGVESSGHNSFIYQRGDKIDKHVLNVVTLEDYCKKENIKKIDILKIDVEGFESKVVKGLGHMLDDGLVGMVIFEISPSLEYDRQESSNMINNLYSNGFRFFDLYLNEISINEVMKIEKHMDVVAIHDDNLVCWN